MLKRDKYEYNRRSSKRMESKLKETKETKQTGVIKRKQD